MAKRADQVDETRQRIVEATVRLHERIGLRATTVTAVAEEAGVTRLTVYRHFPSENELVGACSAHWLSLQEPPDPAAWGAVDAADARLRAGLADLYRFYRAGSSMLTNVYADIDVLPEPVRQNIENRDTTFIEVLSEPLGPAGRQALVRAAVGHAVSFSTWRSLCLERGLANEEAVEVMATLVLAVSSAPAAGEAGRQRRRR